MGKAHLRSAVRGERRGQSSISPQRRRGRGSCESAFSRARALILFFLLASFFGFIILRLFSLQVNQHESFSEWADRQHRRPVPLTGRRGVIYDRHGRELAVSLETASAFAQSDEILDPKEAASKLSTILKLKPEEVLKKLESQKSFVWLKRRLDPAEAQAVAKLGLRGIHLVPESKRSYPKRELAAHVLGFVGMDDKGLEGVEYQYDHLLGGQPRWVVSFRDALGRVIFREEEAKSPSYDLHLTIDEVIQYIAERELSRAVAQSRAKGGTAIVMDPRTGEVLALANLPSYDPNRYQEAPLASRRNRAVTDTYEPGSAFKTIMAAAAIEEGIVRPEDRFYGEMGAIRVGGITIRDHERYNWLTFEEVIAHSSNVGAIKVGMKLGRSLYYNYISSFGFGSLTGIDLPGESAGMIRRPRNWSLVSLGSLSIGQEIAVTPIQMAAAISAVANGGHLMKPFIARVLTTPDGKPVKEFHPIRLRRVISEATARTLTDLLKRVVAEGTGKLAAVDGYQVAGKTGTAQKLDQATGHYSHSKLIASFVGFVPADDPRLTILVVVDEPQGEAWGGSVAAPAFREIAKAALKYLRILPSPGGASHVALRAYDAASRVD